MAVTTAVIAGREFDLQDERSLKPWDYIAEWDGRKRFWYTRFLVYRDLKPLSRTVAAAYRAVKEMRNSDPYGKPLGKEQPTETWWHQSYQAHWADRAAAWDDWVRQISDARDMEKRLERFEQSNEQIWELSQKLVGIVREAMPLVGSAMISVRRAEKRVPDPENPGMDMRQVTEVLRYKAGPTELANTMKACLDMQRTVLGIAPEQVHTVRDGGKATDDSGASISWEEAVRQADTERARRAVEEQRGRLAQLEEYIRNNGLSLPE